MRTSTSRRHAWRVLVATAALVAATSCARNTSPATKASAAPVADAPNGATTVPTATTLLAIPTYVVAKGDTMGKIANSLGIPLETLMAANGMTKANKIFVGQKLRLPASATTTTNPP